MENEKTTTTLRGFAGVDPLARREMARRGGRMAHVKGTAHQWTPEQARIAGLKGAASRKAKAKAAKKAARVLAEDVLEHGHPAPPVA